jgi:hypothetical protein
MELAAIARILWRHRVIALLGAPLVVAIALLGTHRVSLSPFSLSPARTPVGSATARILVDTPKSQLVDLAPVVGLDGSVPDGLPIRTEVLVDQLESTDWRATLARNAGMRADDIDISSSDTGSTHTTPLARALAEANAVANRPNVVRVSTNGYDPIVSISVTAASPADAQRLVGATIATFKSLVESGAGAGAKGFIGRPLGAPRAGLLPQSSGRAMTAGLAVFALGAWLVGIVFAGGIAAAWVSARTRPVASA